LTDAAYQEKLAENMQFYKIASFSLSAIESLYNSEYPTLFNQGVPFDSAKLKNLVQQEALDETYDYESHNTIIARNAFTYNQRLHLNDVSIVPYQGYLTQYANQWCVSLTISAKRTNIVRVYIKTSDGNDRVVGNTDNSTIGFFTHFVYYPDPNAYKMEIYSTISGYTSYTKYTIPLKVHPFLAGSYAINWDSEPETTTTTSIPDISNDPIPSSNRLYISETLNPYIYPSNNIYTVGSGKILGMASVARPLSTGQLGQFCLFVFCSDGNYALSLNNEGTYTNISAIQRDVCVNADSITTLDNEVVYLTSRGAAVTNASSIDMLSTMLNGVPESIPDDIVSEYPLTAASISNLISSSYIAYDYPNQRIIFFGTTVNSFVYALDSQTWSTARTYPIRSVINVYPYAYIHKLYTTKIVKLDIPDSFEDDTERSGIIYTRPMKLDSYSLKRIRQYRLEGDNFSAKVYMYGSMDCVNWHLIGTSTSMSVHNIVGHPYKYFRFAIVVDSMKEYGNISGMRIGFTTDKERRFR
jgi:hypothetical protein